MAFAGCYQFSLRLLLTLVTTVAVAQWLFLQLLASGTPPRGETLVTPREKIVLAEMQNNLQLRHGDRFH